MSQTTITGDSVKTSLLQGNASALALGRLVKAMADADQVLTSSEYDHSVIECTGALTADRNLVVPLGTSVKVNPYIVANLTTGGHNVTVKGATGTGVAIAGGKRAFVYADDVNVVRVTPDT